MGKARTAGVAFFGRSSLDADVKALEWACNHLKLSNKHKLWIIHLDELSNRNTETRERRGSRYEYHDLETRFTEKYDYGEKNMQELQSKIGKYQKYFCGVTFEGPNFKEALQHAVNSLQEHDGLDTLVLAWWAADDTNKGPPIDNLQSKGCSIVLANVHPRNLTFFMPATQGTSSAPMSSTGGTAAPLTAMAPTPNKTQSPTPSKENSRCTKSRETDTAASLAAKASKAPVSVSARNTPAALPTAPAEVSNSERSINAQDSETDTRRSGSGVKDTGHNASARPLSSRKTKII